jgi:hypothetical protein
MSLSYKNYLVDKLVLPILRRRSTGGKDALFLEKYKKGGACTLDRLT